MALQTVFARLITTGVVLSFTIVVHRWELSFLIQAAMINILIDVSRTVLLFSHFSSYSLHLQCAVSRGQYFSLTASSQIFS